MNKILDRTDRITKKAKELGADEAIARTIFGKYRQTRFSNNQIDITVAWNNYVTDIALSWKKRLVTTQIQNFQNVDKQLKEIIDIAKVSKENPMFHGFAKNKFLYPKQNKKKRIIEIETPSEFILEAIDYAEKEAGSDINCGGTLFSKNEQVFLSSTEGPLGIDFRTAVELSIRVFSQREASGHSTECSSTLKNFNPARAGSEAGELASLARNPKPGKEGSYDVILGPLFSGSMLSMWTAMASAFNIMVRLSIFVDRIGEKVSSDIVTLKDNPAPYSVSNRIFDDEGVPIKETKIIEKGIMKTYLHNSSTAKLFKTETTGNAGIVVPQAWNIEMDSGRTNKEEMINEMKKVLYLTNTWYTRFQNHEKGDFSTIPRDAIFLIENGEIKQSLKDIRLSDNASRMLKNIKGVSKERRHVHWWEEADPPSLAPYLLIENVKITKSK